VARFVDDAATRRVEWTRPDKRFIGSGFFMPGRSADSVSCLAAAIDNSGSVSDDELSAFASELQGILDTGKVERLHVVLCDSDVNGSADFVPGDIVRLEGKGGGGTRFGPAFRHLAEHAPDAAAVLYATDLDVAAGDWGTDPGCPVLWLATGGRRSAPFGEVIPLDAYA
jgi:predicted metal-dependent peptidase